MSTIPNDTWTVKKLKKYLEDRDIEIDDLPKDILLDMALKSYLTEKKYTQTFVNKIHTLEKNISKLSLSNLKGEVDDLDEMATKVNENLVDKDIRDSIIKIINYLVSLPIVKMKDIQIIVEDIADGFNGILENVGLDPVDIPSINDYAEDDFTIASEEYGESSKFTNDEYAPDTNWKNQDKEYINKLLNVARKRNVALTSKNNPYRQKIEHFECANDVDYMTQEDIDKKNFLKPGWIYIQNEKSNNGFCYDKESLLKYMTEQVTYGPYPEREYKFFKMPFPNYYVDKQGLETIPNNKAVKLVATKINYPVGLYGHKNHNIYTLEKIE